MSCILERHVAWIYVLCEPCDGSPRYVGKANNPWRRLRRHLNAASRGLTSCRVHRWIGALLAKLQMPVLAVVESCAEDTWREAERSWIAELRRAGADLTNHCDGGSGGNTLDDAARARLSAAMKSRWLDAGFRAKICTTSRSQKIAKALSGLKKSPEHIAKLPQNRPGRVLTHEQRAAISKAQVGKSKKSVISEKMRQRAAEANRGNKHTKGRKIPHGECLARSKKLRGCPKSQAHRERISAAMKLRWAAAARSVTAKAQIAWPSFAWLREQLESKSMRQLAAELGIKPGTLSAKLYRNRHNFS